jgi:hypothetical protein
VLYWWLYQVHLEIVSRHTGLLSPITQAVLGKSITEFPLSLLYSGYRAFPPQVNTAAAWRWQPNPRSAALNEVVRPYIYSPCLALWFLLGQILPLLIFVDRTSKNPSVHGVLHTLQKDPQSSATIKHLIFQPNSDTALQAAWTTYRLTTTFVIYCRLKISSFSEARC